LKISKATEYPKELHFFVYIANFDRDDFPQLYPELLYPLVQKHFNHLVDLKDEEFIYLTTFTTFQQPNCRDFHPLTMNRFSKLTRKWETQKFSIERYRNFNGCRVYIADVLGNVFNNLLEGKVHKIVEKSLNFETVVIEVIDGRTNGLKFGFSMGYQPKRALETSQLFGKNIKDFSGTDVSVHDYVFVISRSAPYSYLKKALLPFDDEVWWCLIGVLAVGVVVIVAVSCMRRQVRNFVFGLRGRAPLLNMV
jgi:hypothetical protein